MSEKRFDKIDGKLEKLDERLDGISVTLAVNTQSLVEHIKRTNALEERLEPVEKHVGFVNAGAKISIFLAGAAGFVVAVLEIIKFFKS